MLLYFKILLVCIFICMTMGQEVNGQSSKPRVSDEQLNNALNDPRYLKRQLKCALDEAPCDPVGRRLKSVAPLVLAGSCPQCTPEEFKQITKVLAHIQQKYPTEWTKMISRYVG